MKNIKPTVLQSLAPIITLVLLLIVNVKLFGEDASYGPNQIALLLSAIVAATIGTFALQTKYSELESKALDTIRVSLQAILILLIVGSLIGVWILNGVVPTMVFYGIKLINPTVFLPLCLIICSVVSLATGSSWSTAGTVGIALIGIGKALGIPDGMVAGAIISGAYFGDKMSPLSDTTNLAPAMAGTDLFTHIRYMFLTTWPSYVITLIIFIVLGISYRADAMDSTNIDALLSTIDASFNITPVLFMLPVLILFLVLKKVPAVPSLALGVILGVVFAIIFQSDLILKLSGEDHFNIGSAYTVITKAIYGGFKSETGNAVVDKLFSRGGMGSMLNTVWMILTAMIFGGFMEVTGMLQTLAEKILSLVNGVGSLITATVTSGVFLNLTTSDQYISIVVSGRMFKTAFAKFGLAPQNLSRAVEDSSTVTSVLIPWNTCGAYFASVLGVSTLTYLPFAFFNLISPLMSIIIVTLGYKVVKGSTSEQEAVTK